MIGFTNTLRVQLTLASARPREAIKPLYDHELKNAPGKSVIGAEVSFSPDAWTPPHRHSGATVVATVTEGEVLSGMNGNPPKVYQVGESFMEMPGCHHTVGENNSKEKPAKMMVVFVIDTEVITNGGYAALMELDAGW
ncbi:Oxalate oxidase GF-3.8 [Emericellopsis cladophorae]|uniref:Oxalate oxidase GF-3.8 n=1 Tax=Emericellopsis cladophorae TaxID=2686198 RepID=A0A9Q0BEC4_9HYPO|nr:Oxalate oxidase GF-3.8 [Emericellopsis cladophorae]KAI6781460.1 Oxalate oxidase GF-3.8 [Emericellopsis cladophorae]